MPCMVKLSGHIPDSPRSPLMVEWANVGPFESGELAEAWLTKTGFEYNAGSMYGKLGAWEHKDYYALVTFQQIEFKACRITARIQPLNFPREYSIVECPDDWRSPNERITGKRAPIAVR
jgi:hypothetical protein